MNLYLIASTEHGPDDPGEPYGVELASGLDAYDALDNFAALHKIRLPGLRAFRAIAATPDAGGWVLLTRTGRNKLAFSQHVSGDFMLVQEGELCDLRRWCGPVLLHGKSLDAINAFVRTLLGSPQ